MPTITDYFKKVYLGYANSEERNSMVLDLDELICDSDIASFKKIATMAQAKVVFCRSSSGYILSTKELPEGFDDQRRRSFGVAGDGAINFFTVAFPNEDLENITAVCEE